MVQFLMTMKNLPRWIHVSCGVFILILLILTSQRCSVQSAVKADRATTQAKSTTKALTAERAANKADAVRQAEIQANDQTTRKAIQDAVSAHPEIVPAGPAVRAASDSLRNRSSSSSASTR